MAPATVGIVRRGESEKGDVIAAARLAVSQASQREADEATMRNLWAGYTGALWVGGAAEAWLMTAHPTLQSTPGGGYLLDVPRVPGWKTGKISVPRMIAEVLWIR